MKYGGEEFAEVWFKPEGEPFALTFRIPQSGFRIPGIDQQLTPENLLKAVGITGEEVESWRQSQMIHTSLDGSSAELREPLPAPPPDVSHLELFVRLKPPSQEAISEESGRPELPSPKWQDIESRWNAVLGVEAGIETLRLTMESVRVELESAWSKQLTPEEKLNALRADLANWTKAKNRIHHVLPKLKEFVHRATWAMGLPERKKLGEFFDNHTGGDIAPPQMRRLSDELESLLKDRQILSAQGVTVHQECKAVLADNQNALRMLQSNATANARRKREAGRAGGKFFKDIRRMSMGNG